MGGEAATLIVVASGSLGQSIAALAEERASYDPERRRVLKPGDILYPASERLARWRGDTGAAALVLNERGELCQRLDGVRALIAAWIDDAFLRARR